MTKLLAKTFLLLILTPLVLTRKSKKDVLVVKAGNGGKGGNAVSVHGDAFGGNGGRGGNNNVSLKEWQSRCARFHKKRCSKATLRVFIAGNGGDGGNAKSFGGSAFGGNGGNGGSNFIKNRKNGRPSRDVVIARSGKGGNGGNAVGFFDAVGGDGGDGGDNNISNYVFNSWHYKNWKYQSRWALSLRPCRCCSDAGNQMHVSAGSGGNGGSAKAFLGDAVGGNGGNGGDNFIQSAVYSTCCCNQGWGTSCGYNTKRKDRAKYGYGCQCKFNTRYWGAYKTRGW